MYTSVLNVDVLSNKDIKRAINEVIKANKKTSNIYKSEIIIQEMILKVIRQVVLFSQMI